MSEKLTTDFLEDYYGKLSIKVFHQNEKYREVTICDSENKILLYAISFFRLPPFQVNSFFKKINFWGKPLYNRALLLKKQTKL